MQYFQVVDVQPALTAEAAAGGFPLRVDPKDTEVVLQVRPQCEGWCGMAECEGRCGMAECEGRCGMAECEGRCGMAGHTKLMLAAIYLSTSILDPRTVASFLQRL